MSVPALYEIIILWLLSQGRSYEEISQHLMVLAGELRGLSPRNILRFCSRRGFVCRRIMDDWRLNVVRSFVGHVGHCYGRRTMHGLLHSRGIRVSQSKLAAAIQCVVPIPYPTRRHDTQRLINPFPYQATYFEEKIHLDQNKKCAMSGVTHVVAIDSYS